MRFAAVLRRSKLEAVLKFVKFLDMNFPRGSEWRKWDLHLHSPATLLNNQFAGATPDEKWEKYVAHLETIQDVCALGVTDYFSIDGYKKLKQFKDAGRLPKIDLIFPNVELRVLPVTDHNKAINFHVLFSPAIADDLDSQFFQNLEFTYSDATYKCTKNDLIRLGREFKQDSALAENVAYETAVNQFKVTVQQVRDILRKNKKLRENCLIAVANGSHDGNSGIQDSSLAATREEIYRLAHIIFSGNPSDVKFFLGLGTDSADKVKQKYGALKPCVIGSDAHELAKVCAPDQNRFTWIKADPTFDGLKQIVFEPEARVRIQENNPAVEFSKPFFTSFKVQSELAVFQPNPNYESPRFGAGLDLPLNHDLVCIIGGRGTGKSCLVDYVGNSFGNAQPKPEYVYSPELSIVFNKDLTDLVSHKADEGAKLPFVYISQSEVKKKIDAGTVGQEIRQMLGLGEAMFDLDVQTTISKLLGDVSGIEVWFKQTNEKGEVINDENGIKNQLAQNESLLNSITTEQNREKLERFTRNVEESQKIRQSGKTLTTLLAELEAFAKKYNQLMTQSGVEIPALDFKPQADAITAAQTKFASRLVELEKDNELIRVEFAKIYTGDLAGLLGNAEAYRTTITKLKARLEEVAKKKQELTAAVEARKGAAELISTELARQKEEIEKKWAEVRNGRPEWGDAQRELMAKILSDRQITLEGKIAFRQDVFFNALKSVLDLRLFKAGGGQTVEQRIAAAFPATSLATFCDFLKNQLHEMAASEKVVGDVVNFFYDLEQRSTYLFVEPQITYHGRPLERLSVGQKGTVYLCLKLATQTFSQPLIFDQPEDDLDNEFIIKELVEIFRGIKRFRQVILVTHNANLVVNADAEQIIVAENRDGLLEYTPGSLEHAETNKAIRRILEGGDDAFRRREMRYNLA
jgi:hypothetical protein